MTKKLLERRPTMAAVVLVVLVVAACAIRLRDDDSQPPAAASADQTADALTTKLAECRTVTYEQKDALSDCRKAWAEKRRQFLGQGASPTPSDIGAPQPGSSLFVPKDQSRVPRGSLSSRQSEKE
jgi:conjugative transfer region protein TrbK